MLSRLFKPACLICAPLFAVLHSSADTFQKLDFQPVANRSFVDETSGDGKGGWTDQGAFNSLPGIRPGVLQHAGVDFTIIDPAGNDDRSVLVFPLASASGAVPAATLSIASEQADPAALYLLHTGAWMDSANKNQVGTITVTYASGKTQSIPVNTGSELGNWWSPNDLPNGVVAYREHNGSANVGLYMSRFDLLKGEGAPASITLEGTGKSVWLIVAATLSQQNIPLPTRQQWAAQANDEWLVYDQSDSAVRPGTALDLTAVFPIVEAGAYGFAEINADGELVFADKPNEPLRLLMHSAAMAVLPARTPEQISQYAEQIALAGYNAYRPHFLDVMLMQGSSEDGVFNPEQLDRWDFLSAELKKRGVYLYMDAMTSWTHFYAVNPWVRKDIPEGKGHMKTRLHYDPEARRHWEENVRKLFHHVNPYTGIALKDDPQVIAVQLRNEASLGFAFGMSGKSPDSGLTEPFRQWLKARYGSTEALRKAWQQQEGDAIVSYLRRGQTLDNVDFPQLYGSGPDSRDLWLFFIDSEQETWQWLAQTAREIGIKVPLTDFNNTTAIQSTITRSGLDLVDNHTYHDHPSNYFNKGSSIGATSSILSGLGYFHSLAATRIWGKPFFCSEWGNVFWSPYRYEAGLTFPAYASLQGWQVLTQFSDPVGLNFSRAVRPFDLWSDPTLKASEYMAAFLYRRSDVKEAQNSVEILIDLQAPGKASLGQAVSPSLASLALVTGVGASVAGSTVPEGRNEPQTDLTFATFEGASLITGEGAQVVAADNNTSALERYVGQLRTAGLIDSSNVTDVELGIFQSDTGELLLNRRNGQMNISTPHSQGATLPAKVPAVQLESISLENHGAPLAVLAASLTKAPLNASEHILLIVSSDALNTGMTFEDDSRRRLVDNGKGPVLLRRAHFDFTLQHENPAQLQLWALAPSGERRERIPLAVKDGSASAVIDTAALQHGPTPYFEIIRTTAP